MIGKMLAAWAFSDIRQALFDSNGTGKQAGIFMYNVG